MSDFMKKFSGLSLFNLKMAHWDRWLSLRSKRLRVMENSELKVGDRVRYIGSGIVFWDRTADLKTGELGTVVEVRGLGIRFWPFEVLWDSVPPGPMEAAELELVDP